MNELYSYHEFDENGDKSVVISKDQILEEYWDYWCKQMLKVSRLPMITEENCVTDFCIIHWAYPVLKRTNEETVHRCTRHCS